MNVKSTTKVKIPSSEYAGNGSHLPGLPTATYDLRLPRYSAGGAQVAIQVNVDFSFTPPQKVEMGKKIANLLSITYPNISTSEDIFGGLPVLSGTRFGVADVLSAVCVYSGLGDAVENYRGRYTEEQFKDAVRFARDFLLESLESE